QRTLLAYLRLLFNRRRPHWEVEQLFADFGPKKPREQQRSNRKGLAWLYGRQGKPPKLQFARWAANLNATLIKKGWPKSELWGSGTTNVENMHHYLKETLRQKEYRDLADRTCASRLRREKIS